ncbi:hypothetical protein AB0F25_09835 [Streptomyces wedmorensis]|uniref:hypothetical protein n=1 Tax=Streptomyces wedmorensis TaxID=43759 RepID=UPI00341AD89F
MILTIDLDILRSRTQTRQADRDGPISDDAARAETGGQPPPTTMTITGIPPPSTRDTGTA